MKHTFSQNKQTFSQNKPTSFQNKQATSQNKQTSSQNKQASSSQNKQASSFQNKNLVNEIQNEGLNNQIDIQDTQDIQDRQDEHLLLENDSDNNISDIQPDDTTKNNKLDKLKISDSNSHYLSQQTLTSSSSKYFLNNYEDDDLSNSESESSIFNNTSKILSSSKYLQNNRFNSNISGLINIKNSISKSNHIEYSTDNTLNKILDAILANQMDLKALLHFHKEIKSTIRLQSEEIKKIKDILNDSHKTNEASSQAQWVEPYCKYIISDIFLDFKYPSDETIKSVALCLLNSKQPKRMQFLINNEEWDSFFRSAICSIAKDKICKHRGTIVKKIKDKLFEVFHDKLNKID
ncbi:hypothetical protein F8M41_011234 [Gigaspora margarita]|uniref:Uncharacterized protein n=1 Tax=Gigaspora margarita TaxID=4874 RepID=A0A8H4AU10_GIGMA|nr:hypothetical protein F8M41_011234 [Gigaspora margarita]